MSETIQSKKAVMSIQEFREWAGVLVLFALLGLLYSPAAAVAAQQTCAESGGMMPGMAMAAPDQDAAGADAADPCCDHGQKHQDSKACVQACAVMCGVAATVPVTAIFVSPSMKSGMVIEAIQALKAHPPPRAERPPKAIA
jgi:hypothetical protein